MTLLSIEHCSICEIFLSALFFFSKLFIIISWFGFPSSSLLSLSSLSSSISCLIVSPLAKSSFSIFFINIPSFIWGWTYTSLSSKYLTDPGELYFGGKNVVASFIPFLSLDNQLFPLNVHWWYNWLCGRCKEYYKLYWGTGGGCGAGGLHQPLIFISFGRMI